MIVYLIFKPLNQPLKINVTYRAFYDANFLYKKRMTSIRYKTAPSGTAIAKNATAPMIGATIGDMNKKSKKLSVIAVMSKIATAIYPTR